MGSPRQPEKTLGFIQFAPPDTTVRGRARWTRLIATAWALQELSIGGEVIPLPSNAHPTRCHGATARLQVVPGAAILEPTGGHLTSAGGEVVPGVPDLRPPRGPHTGGGIQVVRGPAQGQPSGLLGPRRGVVVPLFSLVDPPGPCASAVIESIHRAINARRGAALAGSVRVGELPAAAAPRPRTDRRRGSGIRRWFRRGFGTRATLNR